MEAARAIELADEALAFMVQASRLPGSAESMEELWDAREVLHSILNTEVKEGKTVADMLQQTLRSYAK